jgi:carbon monoxide dehydrogenase subunit G
MRLENSFEVAAPPDAAWRLLNDVPTVVPCMPGAELVAVLDERTWQARLLVKLGPIGLQFLADVRREVADEAAGRALLAVLAREAKGRGTAEATIESTLAPVAAGTRVEIVTELTLRGPVARYGQGVVADVAQRLTAQFADCVARKLAEGSAPAAPDTAAPGDVPVPAPIGGLRLLLGALWRSLFRRGAPRG